MSSAPPSKKYAMIRAIMKVAPAMELLDQIQWYHLIQQLDIRHTVQSNGILLNLKQIPDDQLHVLYDAMAAPR